MRKIEISVYTIWMYIGIFFVAQILLLKMYQYQYKSNYEEYIDLFQAFELNDRITKIGMSTGVYYIKTTKLEHSIPLRFEYTEKGIYKGRIFFNSQGYWETELEIYQNEKLIEKKMYYFEIGDIF